MSCHLSRGRRPCAPAGAAPAILASLLMTLACIASLAENTKDAEEPNVNQTYVVRKAAVAPELKGEWTGAAWRNAETFAVRHFHEQSSEHHPEVQGKLLYTGEGIHVIFRVDDRYVVSRHTQYQDPVCKDSCVEFFVQPKPDRGYLNFEVNCGGALLLEYHERDSEGNDRAVAVPYEIARSIAIYHSMPETVVPEIAEKTVWYVEYFVPFSVFEHYVGPLGAVAGQTWRANFYKCADQSSHPHWGAWAPIAQKLSFHQPRFFGAIRFAE